MTASREVVERMMTKQERAVIRAAMHVAARSKPIFRNDTDQGRNIRLIVALDRACARHAKSRRENDR